jgi:Tfp pilus assembly protein PilO
LMGEALNTQDPQLILGLATVQDLPTEADLFYDHDMIQAVEKIRASRGLAVSPRSPAGLVDEETVQHLWVVIGETGKRAEIRNIVRDIARVRR